MWYKKEVRKRDEEEARRAPKIQTREESRNIWRSGEVSKI